MENYNNNQEQNTKKENVKSAKEKQLEQLFNSIDQKTQSDRTKNVNLRLTEKEHAILKAKSQFEGKTMTEFIVELIEAKKIKGFEEIQNQIDEIFK